MNHFMRRLTTTLAGALLALCASAPAQASLYEISWTWKWGDGRIVFDGDVPDSNPHPLQGSFIGAIQSYDVAGWSYFDETRVTGTGGSISVAATNSPRYEPWCSLYCGPSVVTFQFGSLTLPDANAWQVSLVVPGYKYGGGDGLPPVPLFGGDGMWGNLYLPAQGIELGTISEVTHVQTRVLTPVPEPETWLLMAIGLAGLVARCRTKASA